MTPSSRAEAKAFIDELRKKNGGLTQEQRERLGREFPDALNVIDNLRRQLGASTKTLAANLYAKDTRFVYELIQNAEDNDYFIAKALSDPPWLKFSLHHDRIVIDSNEDGFSTANIKAICSIGESTKSSFQGFIGEKGIGFKSVFKVANKVHVQSGLYSFAFEYRSDGNDNGLGMVTPMNEPYLKLSDSARTRMILYLSDTCDRAALAKEFESLPDTLLLFLKKLKSLSIRIALPNHSKVDHSYSLSTSDQRISIHKRCHITDTSSTQQYWVARRMATDMPHEPARKSIKEAEIVLAFPLDAEDIPIVEEQHTFAFLPLRKAGYKFLIQSDFITQASREDVFDSKWNNRLLEEISRVFLETVSQFLKHPTLRYRWVRYVPVERVADEFWGRLQTLILKVLSTSKLFFVRGSAQLRVPSELLLVTDRFRDEDNKPLLPDTVLAKTAYVSAHYHREKDISVIKRMGLEEMSFADFLVRLQLDLSRSDARMRSEPPESQWHTKVAKLLIKAIEQQPYRRLIELLPIIPLTNGAWVTPKNASLFFPTSGGVDIPTDLPLSLVNATSLLNQSRTSLFTRLGVTECEPSRIFPLIEQRSRAVDVTMQQSTSHVVFVFWHHSKLPTTVIKLRLAPKHGNLWFHPSDASAGWTYCSRYADRYSMSNLLSGTMPDELKGKINFLHPFYYDALEKCERRNNQSGLKWFRDFAQLKHTPQLQARDSALKKSPELDYVITLRPESLLGVLKANWNQYQSSVLWNEAIQSTEVPILCSDELMSLNDTFLPMPRLKTIVARLGLQKGFGFLEELDGLADNTASTWMFLEHFNVGWDTNIDFWLIALRHAYYDQDEIANEVVFEIYSHLQRFTQADEIDAMKESFYHDLILNPSSEAEDRWTSREYCLWGAPDWLSYPEVLCLGRLQEYRTLSSLFQITLEVGNAGSAHFLDYLKYIRGFLGAVPSDEEKARIPLIYNELNTEDNDNETKQRIKLQFEQDKLLYHPSTQSWYSPISCIWAEDNIQLPGKVSIATAYKGKKSFFTKVLGVPKPTLGDHILALRSKTLANPKKEEVMLEMLNICAYNPKPEALEELCDCKCLPITLADGVTDWVDRSAMFSIVDRREYDELFRGKLKVLAFSLEEVHPLESFLHGLGLADRYMSQAVQEETKTPDGLMHRRLTDDLRNKAYAICRYAAHLGLKNSLTGAFAMYEIIQTMDVYVSDSIFKSVSIDQGSETVIVQQDTAYLHIEEFEAKLRIYVPKSKKRRLVCFSRHLPIAILKRFDVSNFSRGSELGSIITAPSLFAVDELLSFAGIIEVAGIERPEVEEDSDDESCTSEDGNLASDAENISEPQTSHQNAGYFSPRDRINVVVGDNPFLSPGTITPATTIFSGSPSPLERRNLYKQLLEAVTAQAETLTVGALPLVGNYVVVEAPASRGLITSLAVSSDVIGEREFKIGAAGELFMYHLLKSLGVPDFNAACWQSTIRQRVAVHHDYQDLSRWSGRETADIVYKDHESFLTNVLINKGYLNQIAWRGLSPTYYIEVKTTTGCLGTPFFCSQGQVDRMAKLQIDTATLLVDTTSSKEVYLIARVFSLGDSGTGLKLYVDPETLRENGELEFKADKFVVTPSR